MEQDLFLFALRGGYTLDLGGRSVASAGLSVGALHLAIGREVGSGEDARRSGYVASLGLS